MAEREEEMSRKKEGDGDGVEVARGGEEGHAGFGC